MSNTLNSVVFLSPCSKSRGSDCWVKFIGLNQSRGNFRARVNGCELCASVRFGHCYMLSVHSTMSIISGRYNTLQRPRRRLYIQTQGANVYTFPRNGRATRIHAPTLPKLGLIV
jgi:hypothetical protein